MSDRIVIQQPLCAIDGCSRISVTRGLCSTHWHEMRPRLRLPKVSTPTEHFMQRVVVDPITGCWAWTLNLRNNGYGFFQFGHYKTMAHRAAYELFVGEIPEGLEIDHLCRRTDCVNPAHLEPVTREENLRRSRLDFCKRGHDLNDPANVYYPPNFPEAPRQCRACTRARRRAERESHYSLYPPERPMR